jgi:RHS repeat-associated protein
LGGNFTAAYDRIAGQIAARIDLPANSIHYYFRDHLGSTNIVTDANGVVENESDYYPYGGEMVITSGGSNRYKFTGKERDSESGLDNFGARYDASSLGRFMTPDWVAGKPSAVPYAEWADPQSLNLYSYARNNPLSRTDPDGHDPGDKFKTKNEAAVDAVKYMRAQKNGYKWEYGTRIHQDAKNFSYGPVVTQELPKGVDPPALQLRMLYFEPIDCMLIQSDLCERPSEPHDHFGVDGDREFSGRIHIR